MALHGLGRLAPELRLYLRAIVPTMGAVVESSAAVRPIGRNPIALAYRYET